MIITIKASSIIEGLFVSIIITMNVIIISTIVVIIIITTTTTTHLLISPSPLDPRSEKKNNPEHKTNEAGNPRRPREPMREKQRMSGEMRRGRLEKAKTRKLHRLLPSRLGPKNQNGRMCEGRGVLVHMLLGWRQRWWYQGYFRMPNMVMVINPVTTMTLW